MKTDDLKLNCIFSLVSVKRGDQAKLAQLISKGVEVPIVLMGKLVDIWGDFDGIDREFEMQVEEATVDYPTP